jgi:hypothetical protein
MFSWFEFFSNATQQTVSPQSIVLLILLGISAAFFEIFYISNRERKMIGVGIDPGRPLSLLEIELYMAVMLNEISKLSLNEEHS